VILKSAIGAIETDPAQAQRAMQVQAFELKRAAASIGDRKLASAAEAFEACLAVASRSRASLEAGTSALWAFMPAGATLKLR
jgi:hypothetical protein